MAISMDSLFVREFTLKDGRVLNIFQCEVGDVGCVVWDAAIVLASYLQCDDFVSRDNGENILKEKNVLELGAGTGLVGIVAACLGAHVTITDLDEFLPLIRHNIEENRENLKGSADASALRWGEDVTCITTKPDYVLLADCIYYDASLGPLMDTLRVVCGPHTSVLCCYEERHTDHKIALERQFHELIKQDFSVEKVALDRQDAMYRSEDIHIYKFKRLV